MPLGVPELFVLLAIGVFYLIPIAAGIWALITLHRIREAQDVINRKLDAMERMIQANPR